MDRLLGTLPGWELGTCSIKVMLRIRCRQHDGSSAILVWNGDRDLRCLGDDFSEQWHDIQSCGLAGCLLSFHTLNDPSERFVVLASEGAGKSNDEMPLDDVQTRQENRIVKSILEEIVRVVGPAPSQGVEEKPHCLYQPMHWYEPLSSRRIEQAAKLPSAYPLIDFNASEVQTTSDVPIHPDLAGLEDLLVTPSTTLEPPEYQPLAFNLDELEVEDDLIIFNDDSSDDSASEYESDSEQSDSGGSQSSQSEPETPPNEPEPESKSEEQQTTTEPEPAVDCPPTEDSGCSISDFPFADSSLPEYGSQFEFPFGYFPSIGACLDLFPWESPKEPDTAVNNPTSDETKAEPASDTLIDISIPKSDAASEAGQAKATTEPETSAAQNVNCESSEEAPAEAASDNTVLESHEPETRDEPAAKELPLTSESGSSEAAEDIITENPGQEKITDTTDQQNTANTTDQESTTEVSDQEDAKDTAEQATTESSMDEVKAQEDKPEASEESNECDTPKEDSGDNGSDAKAVDAPETPVEENNNPTSEEPAEEKDGKDTDQKDEKEERRKAKKALKEKKAREKRRLERANRRRASEKNIITEPNQSSTAADENLIDLVSSPNTWEEGKFEALFTEPKGPFTPSSGPWKSEWDWWEERRERIEDEDEENKSMENSSDQQGDDQPKPDEPQQVSQGPLPYAEGVKELMEMVGIEHVKDTFLDIMSLVTVSKSTNVSLSKERLGAVFTGNPGTGKTTTARLYGQMLASLGLVGGKGFEETSGEWIYQYGIKECKRMIDCLLELGGGVLFIDEAYPMAEHTHCPELNYILSRVEELSGKVVFVFAGYAKEMERFTSRNSGFASRIPIQFKFADFEDANLHQLLVRELKERFGDDMPVEGGWDGRYMRVVSRRIGRGRGKRGFGNAREVQNMASLVCKRYAKRVFGSMRAKAIERDEWRTLPTDNKDRVLAAADLIGPEPSKALMESDTWKKLNAMIGLGSVKRSLRALIARLQSNYEREVAEEPLIASSLHRVFLGNPGTGKTTVAKYYAQILADMGLLTKGEVLLKDPSDFIGEYIGQSEANTRRILEAAKGNVLVVDEAYMLGPRYDGGSGKADCFKTAVIDTIVAQVQATGNEDMAIILVGYREPMQTMLNNVNPGMARRFPMSSAMDFEDYSKDQLQQILHLRLAEQGLRVNAKSEAVALDILERARNRQNFGNAGEVDIMLDRAKDRQQERLAENPDSYKRTLLEPQDLDPDFDRADRATSNVKALFKDYIGYDKITEQLIGYQNVTRNMKRFGMDPRNDIPFTYLFRGPPGTGKTSTARHIGKIFYDMGLLATEEVIECSASELIAEYIGQTGPKTQRVFTKALGKVLIIDEAYRLNDDRFGVEAIAEIVNLLTKTEYQNKLVVVLAGYEDEINELLDSNPGLSSRFPVSFAFPSLTADQCFELLLQELRTRKLSVAQLERSKNAKSQATSHLSTLAQLPAWGNARDVKTLAKQIMMGIMSSSDDEPSLEVTGELLRTELKQMVTEREKRGRAGFGANGAHAYSYYI